MTVANTFASIRNFKRSIEKYIYDNLYTSEGINIDYEGTPFEESSVTEWIRPRILDFRSIYAGKASTTKYGEDVDILYQFDIFVKKGSKNSSDRYFMIRDYIIKYFKIGEDINFNNYTDDSSNLGKIRVRSINKDEPFDDTNAVLDRYLLELQFNYTRETAKTALYLLQRNSDFILTEDSKKIELEQT